MTPEEILRACVEAGDNTSWQAFMDEFLPDIRRAAYRALRCRERTSGDQIDDLIGDALLHMCENGCKVLRAFTYGESHAYIYMVALNRSRDSLRKLDTQRRRGEVQQEDTHPEPSVSAASVEAPILLKELLSRPDIFQNERDRRIFWLRYGHGCTAKEIAAMPDIGLTHKGIESCLARLLKALKGKWPPDALGDMT